MSLKEEIEKIVRAERDKLESRDQGHKEYHERQRKRFQPMRALLEELATSVDTAHLKASIREDSTTVEVGKKEGDRAYFQSDARWRIEPNFQVPFHAQKGESLFSETPGIKVEETVYYRHLEYETFKRPIRLRTKRKRWAISWARSLRRLLSTSTSVSGGVRSHEWPARMPLAHRRFRKRQCCS
jgi:hypothetical protein